MNRDKQNALEGGFLGYRWPCIACEGFTAARCGRVVGILHAWQGGRDVANNQS